MEKAIEKMKTRQEIMDGKLDKLIAQLNGTEDVAVLSRRRNLMTNLL